MQLTVKRYTVIWSAVYVRVRVRDSDDESANFPSISFLQYRVPASTHSHTHTHTHTHTSMSVVGYFPFYISVSQQFCQLYHFSMTIKLPSR